MCIHVNKADKQKQKNKIKWQEKVTFTMWTHYTYLHNEVHSTRPSYPIFNFSTCKSGIKYPKAKINDLMDPDE